MSLPPPRTGSGNAALLERRRLAVARGVATAAPVFAGRADNAELWDVEGRRYIDFASGIAALSTGHRHPAVVTAAREQLECFTHTAFQVLGYESYVALAEKLNELVPGPPPKKTVLFTTGAEAVENAVKIARFATGRPGVLAFAGGFHGRTLLSLALTGKVQPYKAGFGPLPGEVFHAPFPSALHGVSVADALAGIAAVFRASIDPARVAAMVVEPVQGEGGFYVAPPEFLRELRALCSAHGILLVVDEIQTGFGRTGRCFGVEHSGVEPDLVTTAKSLAGGFPLSAVTGRAEVMDSVPPGGLGGTYGGNPVACAAALASLRVLEEERLAERAEAIGRRIRGALESLRSEVDAVAEVRGLGAMLALELAEPASGAGALRPLPELARRVTSLALERGLVVLGCGVHGNVVRVLVPLTIPEPVLDEGLALLASAVRDAAAEARAARRAGS